MCHFKNVNTLKKEFVKFDIFFKCQEKILSPVPSISYAI